jgi:hypothetical protein
MKLIETLDRYTKSVKREKEEALERLVKSPAYELSWVSESLFISSFQEEFFDRVISWLKITENTQEENLQTIKDDIDNQIDRWYPESSTNPISNATSLFKYSALKRIKEKLSYIR